jgi:hypothetical protein
MSLSDKELMMIEDTDFLISKINIIYEIESLFEITKDRLSEIVTKRNDIFFQENDFGKGKISKGENYRSFPFVILDFPAIFDSKNVFAFRTMFWWGNFFSATLHLQGKFFEHFKPKLLANFDLFLNQNIYICIAETPWEYHFGKDNYVQLSEKHKIYIENSPFLKLSKKFQLEQIESVPQITSSFFLNLLKVLSE